MMLTMVLLAFSVYEWGVVYPSTGVVEASSVGEGPKPHDKERVKKPVLYFYGELPPEITVVLGTSPEKITDAYPEPRKIGRGAGWVIKPAGSQEKRGFSPSRWSDPQARLLASGDWTGDFLFYEAYVSFSSPVSLEAMGGDSVVLVNHGDYPVYDIMCVAAPRKDSLLAAYLSYLGPGERAVLSMCCPPQRQGALLTLKGLGFTDGAAGAFLSEWWDIFLNQTPRDIRDATRDYPDLRSAEMPSYPGLVSLVYRLPQDEIDKLLPLRITPRPEKVLRAWWVFYGR